jgi:glutamate-1-semialdehyde 2,1-aminomutase
MEKKLMQATKKSQFLFERAQKSIPSGSTRSPFVGTPYLYAERGQGCYVWDIDGNKYLDFVNNMGPLILGHRHPAVEKAVSQQIKSIWCGAPTELEIELAETILRAFPFCDQVLFTPSGTEAMMKLVRASRAHTKKKKIAVASGSYHGTADTLMCGPGVPEELENLVVRYRYNDEESFRKVINQSRGELAAVVLEAILGGAGSVPPAKSFLQTVREDTERYGIPLIFDEIVSGFRVARGGVSERFRIKPDAVALGKVVGGGFPVGALLGPKELMGEFAYSKARFPLIGNARIPHAGTFNAHPVAMSAGLATLRLLTPGVYEHLERVGGEIRKTLRKLCKDQQIHHSVTGIGSIFRLHFSEVEVKDYETASGSDERNARLFDFLMLAKGVRLPGFHSAFCSTPMRRKELADFERAASESLTEIKNSIGN